MGTSLAAKARGRAIDVAVAIRAALKARETKRALDAATGAVLSEAKGVRNWRHGDAMLIDAHLAGVYAATAALLYAHQPERPPGCPADDLPRPEDLLAVFEAAYETTFDAMGGQS